MSIIGQVARSLQTALGAALDGIGRRTGVIQRQRKFSGAPLFKTVVLTVMKSPNATTDDFVATAAQVGVTVTPEAVEKRFTPKLVSSLRAGCAAGRSRSATDLGYFGLERFRRLSAEGAYWITRWQPGTAVFDADGQPLELREYVRRHQGRRPIDVPILLGSAERRPCRLIVLRVPPEVAARRRQKASERAQKHGRLPGREQLAWCDWTILVTNGPADLLAWKEVVVLYRARGQVELMFKLWKSHNHLATYRETWSAVERMAVFWAKLIGVVLQHWLLLTSTWSDPRRSHWKAARVIRCWIVSLTGALDDVDQLLRTLEDITATIRAVAKQKLGRKRPSSFQCYRSYAITAVYP